MRLSFSILAVAMLFAVTATTDTYGDIAGITTTFTYDFEDQLHTDSAASVTNPSPWVLAGSYNAEMSTYTPQTPRRSGIQDGGGGDDVAFGTYEWIGAAGDYQTFSVSTDPLSGSSFICNLDSISFLISTSGFNGFATGTTTTVEVRASTNGFASFISLGSASITDDVNFAEPNPVNASFDLTGFTDFHNYQGTIDFRMFYTTNNGFASNTTDIQVDDVALTLTAIPEPGVMGLFAIAGFGLIARRRRK